jgi:cupin fold WbuC family metalloprotein
VIETAKPQQAPNIRAEGPDVFYCVDSVVSAGKPMIDFLKSQALNSARKRSRLCTHPDTSALVHEMLIVHHRDVYVRPHRHIDKSESFHRIEGTALVILFGSDGSLRDVLELSTADDAPFYFRIAAGVFHSFVIRSEWLVFHETTAGPFERSSMEFAQWSPDESDSVGVAAFSERLGQDVQSFLVRGAARSERH